MPVHTSFDDSHQFRQCFLSIGNFDGVHLGHLQILKTLTNRAREHQVPAVVLTFDPHPIQLLRPESAPPRLTTLETKADLLLAAGVDHVVVYRTDENLLSMTADEFFEEIVVKKFTAQGLIEGPNFFYGKQRSGNIGTLSERCIIHNMSLDVVRPQTSAGEMISSSAIRQAILAGDVRSAGTQLGRPYSISGEVTLGDQRGRTIGFPTANLVGVETLIPDNGVYAAFAEVIEQTKPVDAHLAAVNIGPNPTFGVEAHKIEAHLLSYSGDLYGKQLRLNMIERIRGTQQFNSPEELQRQIASDLAKVIKAIDRS